MNWMMKKLSVFFLFLHLAIVCSFAENAPTKDNNKQQKEPMDERHSSLNRHHSRHPSHGFNVNSNVKEQQNVDKKLTILDFPEQLIITIGTSVDVQFTYRSELHSKLELIFESDQSLLKVEPNRILLGPGQTNNSATLTLTGLSLSSRTYLDLSNCSLLNETEQIKGKCPFDMQDVFVLVTIVKSNLISIFVLITGWIYFFAWSISFYPQILLNWERKSVVGLNFDFLLLNVIGFACYTIYNVVLYFDSNVQDIYVARHGDRTLIPVLLNDVVFALHALFACLITAFQCFIYERGNQRISYTCRVWASILLCFSFVSLFLGVIRWMNWLDFINYLAYVKMAITMSKYFPQAILNFRRKSTLGWSIGNVLLDFTGGSMDICQMILQASNTADWSAFTGNPVKFGLGLISMIFDVLFIVQHYVLYPHKEVNNYDQVADDPAPAPTTHTVTLNPNSDDLDTEPVVFP